ncbi:MAG: DUF5107 domain-containing protein [Propionibacteriaceae bacterium]|jgi:tetratricopeptide (TPR) repeat protein|nr:DUF5107 domain-containing protein [Propionibacteriaceae bacterium]
MESKIVLPERPAGLAAAPVAAWEADVVIDSYPVGAPDPYPEYLATRVFQGSSGAVFPMPFFDSISHEKAPKAWRGLHLENDYVRLLILPELGGRIHIGMDRLNGYDFFYRNNVIKPALVGLTGPWLSGGVEFNWPQHHRPATFLPVDWHIEQEDDGAVTVWCSDHDPFARMKGMHGVRLRPGSALIELRVRLFNRTEDVQTFLWWANVAARVGDDYQSFFPPDVTMVADHAKRACATFPRVSGHYYGVDYPARVDADHPDADRLDWYKNIPVPTSYMIIGTSEDFFGGYDHAKQAGFVYWADHRIAPGKKQWTWGNAEFGWAWDRQLTDTDGPYVELMAGAFTDNQPDFSYLMPGETKSFSQYWYPIQQIGPVQSATRQIAGSLSVSSNIAKIGLCVTEQMAGLSVELVGVGLPFFSATVDMRPGEPYVAEVEIPTAEQGSELELFIDHAAAPLLHVAWEPPDDEPLPTEDELPILATPIPPPDQIATVEELYLSARHLEQYRHATRSPEPYLEAALQRDPEHAPSLLMLSARRYRQACFDEAANLAQAAVDALTRRNPNPYSGEAHYRLGKALRRLGLPADEALVKAAWDAAWRGPALATQAQADLERDDLEAALRHIRAALDCQGDNTRLRNLMVIALRRSDGNSAADAVLADTRQLDPLDWWARDLAGELIEPDDPQILLDIACEYRAIGDWESVVRLAKLAIAAAPRANPGLVSAVPMAHYYLAEALDYIDDEAGRDAALKAALDAERGTCQICRLDDYEVLDWAFGESKTDANAAALLGNWLYHVRRPYDAQEYWQLAARFDPADAISLRNLGVAAYNVDHDPVAAADYYRAALRLRPDDAKLVYEYDQLRGRLGDPVADRLEALRSRADLVAQRDDLTAATAELATIAGDPAFAVELLRAREFGPWEGGEGVVLGAWEHAHYALAAAGVDPVATLRAALDPPENLGEARHLLANASALWLALGDALAAAGDTAQAREWWSRAAYFKGDFQSMSVMPYSDLTYYSVLALRRLGETAEADALLAGLDAYIAEQEQVSPTIDYFATSLPTMLLFAADLDEEHARYLLLLRAQTALLRGQDATPMLDELTARDPAKFGPYSLRSLRQ